MHRPVPTTILGRLPVHLQNLVLSALLVSQIDGAYGRRRKGEVENRMQLVWRNDGDPSVDDFCLKGDCGVRGQVRDRRDNVRALCP